MRKSFVALLLLTGAAAFSANLALAAIENDLGTVEGLKLQNAQMAKELATRASRLGTSSGNTDTTFVGFTPGNQGPNNYWSIYAGGGKAGFGRLSNGAAPGVWNFDQAQPGGAGSWGTTGDSLQGWVPLRSLYNGTGGQDRTDRNRAWWAIDIGNTANYVSNQTNKRTFGVDGVWHRDPGNSVAPPAGLPPPNWAPLNPGGLGGTHNFSAWMGLRAHGDNTARDNGATGTGNSFNEDVLMYNGIGPTVSVGGNDKAFPGFGSQMDQMLYRDYQVTNLSAALTVAFDWQTEMSTGIGTVSTTRTGWWDKDPLSNPSGASNAQLNNFISSSDAGDAAAPRDSFMVYVGAPVDGSDQWKGSDGALHSVYDKKHRWFAEVLHSDLDPASPAGNPQPLYYSEILSRSGSNAAARTTIVVSNATLQKIYAKSTNKVRLLFRVKTNRGFDDEGTAFSSSGKGAAQVDNVVLTENATVTQFGNFEGASDINNDPNVSALSAWKSTGKPPAIFHHVHTLDQLIYEDLCGQPGDATRVCNMFHNVVSAGDHDASEAAGGLVDGTSERERFDGVISPSINLAGPYDGSGRNPHGIFNRALAVAGNADPGEDFYVLYDIYAGIMDPFTKGNLWRFAFQSYPALSRTPWTGPKYPAWSQLRFPGFIIFNPDQQCLQDIEGGYQNSLITTDNADGIPDSIRVQLSKVQQCFRFGVSTGCAPTDGCYWDNVSFVIIDGVPAQLSTDIWQWVNDAFPSNETGGYPGVPALFDTAGAVLRTGLNVAPSTNTKQRYDIPGDSTVVIASPGTARVDIVFRILPGPGDYDPRGDGATGYIKKLPNLLGAGARVVAGDNSFWDQYRRVPGTFATPGAGAKHLAHPSGWDPNVWNSARCDTAEVNVYAFQGLGVLGGPADSRVFMTTYHENDPHISVLGQVKNRCFVRCQTCAAQDIICDGSVPTYLPAGTVGTTREFTKIFPDGILTCGAHVEYFFRDVKGSKDDTLTVAAGIFPDTNRVSPQIEEGSTDGHRWQEFSVLPDCWKSASYTHPVFRALGRGPACMLVVDQNDRRGNERVWVSVADTIGATEYRKWGAHNGWHAVGGGGNTGVTVDINNPANHRNPATTNPAGQRVGYVAEHGGQAGTTWDFYQVKASESLTTSAGSLGSRLSFSGGNAAMANQRSRQGPTPEMLETYYKMILLLSGDLNSGVLGAFKNRSQNDIALLSSWLLSGDPAVQNRGFWAMGDGFVESEFGAANADHQALLSQLGVDLQNPHYTSETGNTDNLIALRSLNSFTGKGVDQLYGIRNVCLWTNDVLFPANPTLSQVVGRYAKTGTLTQQADASVFHIYDATEPWKSLVDGWDIEHLTSYKDIYGTNRNAYFLSLFTNIWAKLCVVAGTPIVPLDVPGFEREDLVNFVKLSNNPLFAGKATIHFGNPRSERIQVKVFDVSGRLVRTLADRQFTAGEHDILWDGVDDAGKASPRGVYFTQVRFLNSSWQDSKKLTLLR